MGYGNEFVTQRYTHGKEASYQEDFQAMKLTSLSQGKTPGPLPAKMVDIRKRWGKRIRLGVGAVDFTELGFDDFRILGTLRSLTTHKAVGC